MSRRIRSFIFCLAATAVLPLALPAAAAAQSAAAPPAGGTAAQTSGIPTQFAGGCESGHHLQPPSAIDLQQQT